MSEVSVQASGPFNTATVGELIRLMAEHELSEIDLHDGTQRIRLRKGPLASAQPMYAPAYAQPQMMAPSAPQTPTAGATASPAPAAPAGKPLLEIRAKTVGTFYSKPKPDKDDYVKVGASVSPDTVVCDLEAMKVFNPIPAEVTGRIVEILVQNQQYVEYDQVMFRVDPG